MKQFENRLAKLEKVTKLKPCVWVFVPEADCPDSNNIDTNELRRIAEKKFGITDFYLSAFNRATLLNRSFSSSKILKRLWKKQATVNASVTGSWPVQKAVWLSMTANDRFEPKSDSQKPLLVLWIAPSSP